jgi:hypothetical protein
MPHSKLPSIKNGQELLKQSRQENAHPTFFENLTTRPHGLKKRSLGSFAARLDIPKQRSLASRGLWQAS